ncbi:MAG: DUF1573 domain-containing protein [Chitinophagaceae bacterium]|nr:DUF1573 domain-containing protein [Chitinophagaceae bacterium]
MKFIFQLACLLPLSFAGIAQTSISPVKSTNTQIQSKQNVEVKQEVLPNIEASSKSTAEEIIALKETEFDFGKIPQGKPVTHVFMFSNKGKTPLSLENVQASCGCTTPEWSKDPVAPGETSQIIVGYNAANEGAFIKSITISYNGNQTKQINIKGEVWSTPATSAPENSALGTLKK